MRANFIELDRRFLEISPTKDPEDLAFASYLRAGDQGLTWKEVLAHRCVVVLGEAGSGKSWELESQTERLRLEGDFSFLIRLELLIQQNLTRALNPDDVHSFELWKKSSRPATFFLDSVDEARLTSRVAFHAALQNFAHDVAHLLPKIRVVVSCRVSEWNWDLDPLELRKQLKLEEVISNEKRKVAVPERSNSTATAEFFTCSILPLDRARVEKLASKIGVRNTKEFAQALDQSDAWDYVGRPGDVSDIAKYWIDRGRLGTLTELLDFSIDRRLQESEERNDSLSAVELKKASEDLAAAATFCKSFSFSTLDNAASITTGHAINPRLVLPTWSPTQLRALQQRAIFDGEHFGKIRFHHRNVVEYLTAGWVARLVNAPVRAVLGLLFASSRGRTVLIPSRAALAAWISSSKTETGSRVRVELLRAKPEILFSKGEAKAKKIVWPRFSHPGYARGPEIATMGMPITAEGRNENCDINLATRNAVLEMIQLLQERGWSKEQAYILCSVAVDLRISNVVDVPNVTVSAFLPEDIFSAG